MILCTFNCKEFVIDFVNVTDAPTSLALTDHRLTNRNLKMVTLVNLVSLVRIVINTRPQSSIPTILNS